MLNFGPVQDSNHLDPSCELCLKSNSTYPNDAAQQILQPFYNWYLRTKCLNIDLNGRHPNDKSNIIKT